MNDYSDTSFKQQQTDDVVAFVNEEDEQSALSGETACSPVPREEPSHGEEGLSSAPSSGKNSEIKSENFPELIAAVAQAVGLDSSVLPKNLRRAIAQYPEQVERAIAYLQHQQQKRRIENPVGYLYEAIVSNWGIAVIPSGVPVGFNEWFNWAKKQGQVLAATTVEGVHHTLHTQRGWLPTAELMREDCGSSTMHK